MTARKQIFILINQSGAPVMAFASPIDALDHCAKFAARPKVKGRRRRLYQVRAFDLRPVDAGHRRELTKLSDRLRVASRRAAIVKLPNRSSAKVARKTRKRAKR